MKNGIPLPPRFREQSLVHSIEFPKPDRSANPFWYPEAQRRAKRLPACGRQEMNGGTNVVCGTATAFQIKIALFI